jgi:hypothetical protein
MIANERYLRIGIAADRLQYCNHDKIAFSDNNKIAHSLSLFIGYFYREFSKRQLSENYQFTEFVPYKIDVGQAKF